MSILNQRVANLLAQQAALGAAYASAAAALQTALVNLAANDQALSNRNVLSVIMASSILPVTIGGTAHNGDVLTLNITPPGASLVAVTYTMASDTLQSGATALAAAVNANATLTAAGISADTTPVSGAFNLHYSGTAPTVAGSVTGTGATTTLAVGTAAPLSTLAGSSMAAISAGSSYTFGDPPDSLDWRLAHPIYAPRQTTPNWRDLIAAARNASIATALTGP